MTVDREDCPDIERILGKVSGAWLVKGTRIRVGDVIANAVDYRPEQTVAEIHPSLPLDRVQRVVAVPNTPMQHILLDENTPIGVRSRLPGLFVATAP